MARPARARVVGDVVERREALEAVSADCSAARRESWVVAKVGGERNREAMSGQRGTVGIGALVEAGRCEGGGGGACEVILLLWKLRRQ